MLNHRTRTAIRGRVIPRCWQLLSSQKDRSHMALPSRLGAFMVGAALGAAQCFYWLHDDVNHLHAAMTAKIDHIKSQMEEKDRVARLELAAIEAAVARDSSAEANRQPV